MEERDITQKLSGLRPTCSLYIVNPESCERIAFDLETAKILNGVIKYGSMNRAVKELGMSYSHSWQKLRDVERVLDVKLIVSNKGPAGSKLTGNAYILLDAYEGIAKKCSGRCVEIYNERVGC